MGWSEKSEWCARCGRVATTLLCIDASLAMVMKAVAAVQLLHCCNQAGY